jgi:hypothetical protein
MNLEELNNLIDAAYNNSIVNPQRIFAYEVSPNTTIQVDLYETIIENGFRVICKIKNTEENTITIRSKNYGPDINSEINWTTYNIVPYMRDKL